MSNSISSRQAEKRIAKAKTKARPGRLSFNYVDINKYKYIKVIIP